MGDQVRQPGSGAARHSPAPVVISLGEVVVDPALQHDLRGQQQQRVHLLVLAVVQQQHLCAAGQQKEEEEEEEEEEGEEEG